MHHQTLVFRDTSHGRSSGPRAVLRERLIAQAALTPEDLEQVEQRRRDYNRLGFAYQIAFVRLTNRFPAQHPFEVVDELLAFTGAQLGIDPDQIDWYSQRQQTISEHQIRIRDYLGLRPFGEESGTSSNASCSRNAAAWSRRPPCGRRPSSS